MSVKELRRRQNELNNNIDDIILDLTEQKEETRRVINVLYNTPEILDDLDREFETKTELDSLDVKFLFFAIALQCVRQYVFSNDKFRFETDQKASKFIKKYAPIDLTGPVSYDAIHKTGDYSANTGISGINHRYTTLGHDPLLGWIFGTANILTDTITKNNIWFESYKTILVGNEYKISAPTNIASVFSEAVFRVQQDYKDLALAVGKHAIHLASDSFTKMGLPVPIINSASPKLSAYLLKNNIDVYSITRGTTLSILINAIISAVHNLYYDEVKYPKWELYNVKTRKIIMYSNVIASASNVIYVAISAYLGNSGALKQLDIGGIIVTIYRLFTDIKFIHQVKEEFIYESYRNMIMGDYE